MMGIAKKRKIDVVLVWRYDCFAHSTQVLVNALKKFQSLGIDFISYQENIDTTIPTGELIFYVMALLAQFKSFLISQRVKAGMTRAKAQGKHIRSSINFKAATRKIIGLMRERVSMNKISKTLGIAYGTGYNYRSKAGKTDVL